MRRLDFATTLRFAQNDDRHYRCCLEVKIESHTIHSTAIPRPWALVAARRIDRPVGLQQAWARESRTEVAFRQS